jgi:hypothetical protein
MEFTGEDRIDHTVSDKSVRFYTGNAYDIGENVAARTTVATPRNNGVMRASR